MELKDFMDLKALQELQDNFSEATGLAAIAVDQNGEYLTRGSNRGKSALCQMRSRMYRYICLPCRIDGFFY